jgi:ribonuclease P protein component
MITSRHRFHGLGSLRFVFTKGETIRSAHCSLRYALNPRRSSYRLAVIVSRKVHKNAVVRNRIRRRVYEIVRAQEKLITRPFDLAISVYSDQLATMPAKELERTLINLLKKAGVIELFK